MAVPSEASSKTLGVSRKFSPRRFPQVRICVYLFCSSLTSLLDFSDLTPKITNWEEAEPFRTVGSNHTLASPSLPSSSVPPSRLRITRWVLPKARLSWCQSPDLGAHVWPGHLTQLLIESYKWYLLELLLGPEADHIFRGLLALGGVGLDVCGVLSQFWLSAPSCNLECTTDWSPGGFCPELFQGQTHRLGLVSLTKECLSPFPASGPGPGPDPGRRVKVPQQLRWFLCCCLCLLFVISSSCLASVPV